MLENWKKIDDFPNYEISDLGNIRNVFKNTNIKNTLRSDGYLTVGLSNKGTVKNFLVHRLLLSTFIGRFEDKPVCNHKNGIKSDNRLENLEWCTQKYNTQHAWINGLNKSTTLSRETTVKNNKLLKGVILLNLENGVFYDSIRDASLSVGCAFSSLQYKLNHNNTSKFIVV